ncbi:hypothetical protein [Mycolicibacterium goodii]|uniref:hypothetical protein n=1 Tax=Mycolicibacterium goodii TaxID=134601 RepID=UPI001055C986|nr:hypothetical protein [Mycolicibacterium goodii]
MSDWYTQPDDILQDFITMAGLGVGLPVTLYMPWGVVSGHIAADNAFFKDSATRLRAAAGFSSDEREVELADAIAGRVFDAPAQMGEDERLQIVLRDGRDLTRFIHLERARCSVGGSAPVEHSTIRVRLADVTAWTYGALGAPTPGSDE